MVKKLSDSEGKVHKNTGNFEKAKTIFQDCLVAFEKQDDNYLIPEVLIELAEIYFIKNDLEKTESFLNRALDIYQKRQHPLAFIVFEDFAELHLKKALNAKNASQQALTFKIHAINNLKKALNILKANFPEDSPHRIRIQDKLKALEKEYTG